MANYGGSNTHVIHKTSAAGVEDVITLAPTDAVIVTNRSGASTIFYRTDNVAAVAAADDTYMVPASIGSFDQHRVKAAGRVMTAQASTGAEHPAGQAESAVVVRLISAAATDYTVEIVE